MGHPHDSHPRALSRLPWHCAMISVPMQRQQAHRPAGAIILSSVPSCHPPQTPRGRGGPARSQVRGPGGRQAGGFGLCLSKTMGLCQGDQVTWVLPVLRLGGHAAPPGEARLLAGVASSLDQDFRVSLLCAQGTLSGPTGAWTSGSGRSHPRERRISAALG